MKLDDNAVVGLRLEATRLAAGDVVKAQTIVDFVIGTTDKEENATLRQQLADATLSNTELQELLEEAQTELEVKNAELLAVQTALEQAQVGGTDGLSQ